MKFDIFNKILLFVVEIIEKHFCHAQFVTRQFYDNSYQDSF